MGRQAWWGDGFPHPTGSQGAWPSPGHAVAAMVSVHPFAAPQASWAQHRGLPPSQPWVGICPDTSLQTCCGQSRPRLPALPRQREEEEEAAAGWKRLWKERERDTSQAVGQEGSAVLATRYGMDWAGAAPVRGLCCLHVDLAAEPSSRPLRSQWGHAPSLRAPGRTQGPSHPSSHPQSGSRAGLAAPGDLASALAHAVAPARTGYRLAGQGPGGSWRWVWGLCAGKATRTGVRHFPGAGRWDGNCAAPSGAVGQQAGTNHCPTAGTAAYGLLGSPHCRAGLCCCRNCVMERSARVTRGALLSWSQQELSHVLSGRRTGW